MDCRLECEIWFPNHRLTSADVDPNNPAVTNETSFVKMSDQALSGIKMRTNRPNYAADDIDEAGST